MRPLIDPLWFLLALLAIANFSRLGLLSRFKLLKFNKWLPTISRMALITLIFLSTGVATSLFDQVLATESSPTSDWKPEFIFVLGGGYEVGATKAQDFLGTESIRRVNAASAIWEKYPSAKVVFSGKQPDTQDDREATRHGELSAEHAISIGLTKDRIIIEWQSQNTREHPIEALKISGVSKNTAIAIITSDFHLRRALGEFKKYFDDVSAFGTGDSGDGLSWLDFVPLSSHLNDNAYRIKEFAGILIY